MMQTKQDQPMVGFCCSKNHWFILLGSYSRPFAERMSFVEESTADWVEIREFWKQTRGKLESVYCGNPPNSAKFHVISGTCVSFDLPSKEGLFQSKQGSFGWQYVNLQLTWHPIWWRKKSRSRKNGACFIVFLVNAFKKSPQASVFTSICPIVLRDLGADGTTLGRIQGFKEPSVGWIEWIRWRLSAWQFSAEFQSVFFCFKDMLHMGVSKNRGTPKWMVYNGKPY